MPRYPDNFFKVFTQMIPTGVLLPVVNVLNSNSGTHLALNAAINHLSNTEQTKYRDALDYLRWTYPGAPTRLNNQNLLLAITRPNAQDAQIQTALDLLTATQAEQDHDGIAHLLTRRPKLFYFGVVSLNTGFNGALNASFQNNGSGVRYTSKAFHATGEIYAITPANARYDVGWVQICTGRTQRHNFAQHNLNSRWEIANNFPINDSSSDQNIPWYHVGVGYNCANPTAARNVTLDGRSTYELDDGFVNNSIGIRQNYRENNVNKSALLQTITRQQSFEAWLAVVPHGTTKYRLLRKVAYEFDFTVTMTVMGNSASLSCNDVNHVPVVTTPGLTDTLPRAAVNGPTMNAGDTLKVYVGNTLKGNQNSTVPVV